MRVAVTSPDPTSVHVSGAVHQTHFVVDLPSVPTKGDMIGSLDEVFVVELVEWVCDPRENPKHFDETDAPIWDLSDVILRCKRA